MGHESKFKESKEREMKYLYTFLLGLTLSIGFANAQAIDPNSMLGNELSDMPEVNPEDPGPLEFVPLPLTAKCLPMAAMKGLVENIMRQETLVIGFNGMHTQQNSPFDGLIIARNPITLEYTVMLISSGGDAACIIAIGTQMQLKSEQNTE
tara:strand:- start:2059 stop:2511 length:453 start_codon:yes stop_codon:yes gene_type:complete